MEAPLAIMAESSWWRLSPRLQLFLSRNLLLPGIMASLVSLFTATIVDLPMPRPTDRRSASEGSRESVSGLRTQARRSETTAQQP